MAIRLARGGEGKLSCEPLAGAVAVKEGRVAGRGSAGGAQSAAVSALDRAGRAAFGSTVYTNIFPRNESLERLIECRPARVVVGAGDSDPVADRLRGAGV